MSYLGDQALPFFFFYLYILIVILFFGKENIKIPVNSSARKRYSWSEQCKNLLDKMVSLLRSLVFIMKIVALKI